MGKEKIILVKPDIQWEQKALDYRQAHFDYGERVINGSELLDQTSDYREWLEKVRANAHEKTVDPNWVLTDTFFAVRVQDQAIVGIIDLRYALNDFLKDFGNCGYSVRPSERGKGYATEMLSQVCELAKARGMTALQLSVERSNSASVRTIQKNNGLYTRSFWHQGQEADIYTISLG